MQKIVKEVKTTEELVKEYQAGNTEQFDLIVARMDRLIGRFAVKTEGTGETFDDLKSILTHELWNCCNNWNGKTKLTTMFWTYADNKLREIKQKAHHLNQFANTYATSFDAMRDDKGFDIRMDEFSYEQVQWLDLIERLSLTPNERRLIEIRMEDDGLSKKEIADLLGVDKSAINYFEKSIARKVLSVA